MTLGFFKIDSLAVQTNKRELAAKLGGIESEARRLTSETPLLEGFEDRLTDYFISFPCTEVKQFMTYLCGHIDTTVPYESEFLLQKVCDRVVDDPPVFMEYVRFHVENYFKSEKVNERMLQTLIVKGLCMW